MNSSYPYCQDRKEEERGEKNMKNVQKSKEEVFCQKKKVFCYISRKYKLSFFFLCSFLFLHEMCELKSLVLVTEHLDQVVSGVGLWSLQGHTECTVPAELRKDTESTGDTEEDSVVVLLDKTVVLEENARVGINIGPGVLGLSVFSQDTGLKGE
jgi:hypothetical protein